MILGSGATVPTVPVQVYGGALLSELGTLLLAVLPYAAAVTVFVVGLGMLKRWLGHRKGLSLGGGGYWDRPVYAGGRGDYAGEPLPEGSLAASKARDRRSGREGFGNRTWRRNMGHYGAGTGISGQS